MYFGLLDLAVIVDWHWLYLPMSEPKIYKTEAIVLKHADWGEADRILTLYTSKIGKMRAVVKGARKTTSRLGGHVEPLTHCSMMLVRGRQLDTVSQSQTIYYDADRVKIGELFSEYPYGPQFGSYEFRDLRAQYQDGAEVEVDISGCFARLCFVLTLGQ